MCVASHPCILTFRDLLLINITKPPCRNCNIFNISNTCNIYNIPVMASTAAAATKHPDWSRTESYQPLYGFAAGKPFILQKLLPNLPHLQNLPHLRHFAPSQPPSKPLLQMKFVKFVNQKAMSTFTHRLCIQTDDWRLIADDYPNAACSPATR